VALLRAAWTYRKYVEVRRSCVGAVRKPRERSGQQRAIPSATTDLVDKLTSVAYSLADSETAGHLVLISQDSVFDWSPIILLLLVEQSDWTSRQTIAWSCTICSA